MVSDAAKTGVFKIGAVLLAGSFRLGIETISTLKLRRGIFKSVVFLLWGSKLTVFNRILLHKREFAVGNPFWMSQSLFYGEQYV